VLGPVGYAKFLAPVALWILGLSAWFSFRQLKFSPLAATLGGLAAMLISAFFSDACWGVAAHEIAIGMDFCALGLFAANSPQTPALVRWARLALAGLAVGVSVMEAADIGAILSVFVALFVFWKSFWEENGAGALRICRSIKHVAIITMFAGIIAWQAVSTLVGTSITGISGTGQDAASKMRQWDFTTQWSLPKKETLGLFVPGLFGYRMDTPKDMMPMLQDAYKAGNYWGGIGRTPMLDRYFDSGSQGQHRQVRVLLCVFRVPADMSGFWSRSSQHGRLHNRCGDKIPCSLHPKETSSGLVRLFYSVHCCWRGEGSRRFTNFFTRCPMPRPSEIPRNLSLSFRGS
jgi:hypothetical protein